MQTKRVHARGPKTIGDLIRFMVVIVCACVVAPGCTMFKSESEESRSKTKNAFGKKESRSNVDALLKDAEPSEKAVRLSGGLTLGDTDNLAFTSSELAELLDRLLNESKVNSVRGLIGLYPDLVSKLLIGADGNRLSFKRLKEIAQLFDQQWSGNGQDTWVNYLNSISRNGQAVEFVSARNSFLAQLQNNEPKKALALKIRENGATRNTFAKAETLRLEGIAYLMLENHQQSSNHFRAALQLLTESHPYPSQQNRIVAWRVASAFRRTGRVEVDLGKFD